MNTALLISITVKDFAGSELATLEQANYLEKLGWQVSIFTLELGSPLKELIPDSIAIFDLNNVSTMPRQFNLIIARQYPLLDYIIFNQKITASKIYYECVGYALPQDTFPIYYKHLSLTGAVSETAKTKLEEKGFDCSKTFISPNTADDKCYEIARSELPNIPANFAIVSNHMPTEILEVAERLRSLRNTRVDLYGMGHNFIRVTPELLSKYDVVITIGKTAFNSTSLGIPTYCYDENVSSGYVTESNLEANVKWNFAIKENYRKKNVEEIKSELFSEFSKVSNQQSVIKNFAKAHFSRAKSIEVLLNKIDESPDVNFDELYANYPGMAEQSRTFVEYFAFSRSEILRWYNKSTELGDLYQNEMSKFLSLCKANEDITNQLNALLSSKGWKLLEILRKPIKVLKR